MSEDPLVARRKRLRFQAWHRGTREADLLLGSFADAWLERFDETRLGQFEALLEVPDPDLYNWITAREPMPPVYDTEVARLLQTFRFAA